MLSLVIIIGFCLLGNAFFAGMEIGVLSIHRLRLRHHVEEKEQWAILLDRFLDQPDRLLGTTLIGTNLCMVMASVLVASIGSRVAPGWGEALLGLMLTVMVLVFGEYLPKAWFQSHPMKRCRIFAKPLDVARAVFHPLEATVTWLTHWLVPAANSSSTGRYPFVTRDELKVLAQEGEVHGVLSPNQRLMIHRAFELAGKRAAHIMVPRSKAVTVGRQTTVVDFLRIAHESGFTRLPVYDEAQEQFVGIVNVFEVLAHELPDSTAGIAEYVQPPQFIRDTTPLTEILPRLRRSRLPMCLVTDEPGKVVGLITTQNIVAEIVGNMTP